MHVYPIICSYKTQYKFEQPLINYYSPTLKICIFIYYFHLLFNDAFQKKKKLQESTSLCFLEEKKKIYKSWDQISVMT